MQCFDGFTNRIRTEVESVVIQCINKLTDMMYISIDGVNQGTSCYHVLLLSLLSPPVRSRSDALLPKFYLKLKAESLPPLFPPRLINTPSSSLTVSAPIRMLNLLRGAAIAGREDECITTSIPVLERMSGEERIEYCTGSAPAHRQD